MHDGGEIKHDLAQTCYSMDQLQTLNKKIDTALQNAFLIKLNSDLASIDSTASSDRQKVRSLYKDCFWCMYNLADEMIGQKQCTLLWCHDAYASHHTVYVGALSSLTSIRGSSLLVNNQSCLQLNKHTGNTEAPV